MIGFQPSTFASQVSEFDAMVAIADGNINTVYALPYLHIDVLVKLQRLTYTGEHRRKTRIQRRPRIDPEER